MGTQDYVADKRNQTVVVYVNGRLVPRSEATVSIFDSGFILGDGIWEGFRLHRGRVAFAKAHLERLFDGAKALDFNIGLTAAELLEAITRTIDANGMTDGVHIRLMVTRGTKKTPNQDPRHALGRATVVVVAEYKLPNPEAQKTGITLFTSTIRSTGPDTLDAKLNSHSRLGLILALVQATKAGADEALLLDPQGFVCTCNATNFFFVKKGRVLSSTGRYGFNGITRGHVIKLCQERQIPIELGDFSLADVYAADEAFVTGTFGGLTPVRQIDGRMVGEGQPGPVTTRVQGLYRNLLDLECSEGRPND